MNILHISAGWEKWKISTSEAAAKRSLEWCAANNKFKLAV